jgi:filamentous hemagglutinin family protein
MNTRQYGMASKALTKHRTVNAWTSGVFYAVLLLHGASVPRAFAGPEGGQVVGGNGSISQSGATTMINQSTQSMVIDWQSYNLNVDERVQYLQPNVSAISLNRILSNDGSIIAGQIDANGQVILVNPNGIFFTSTATLNVGGIIVSGLDIAATDFMNGNYIFNEVLGSEGKVVNSGTINAALGGSVTLLGKQVENDGLIVATLGSVNLAAGKQAVLTFDDGGLLGVRVTEHILQSELGMDPAVLNSGQIKCILG